ncbi:hypothetical protein [Ethanoligenens sp.]|uniref:hypothetical protein n=1 Tax=Ethanoligenens sp. TaxID=2099655 RepID=UPI0039EAEC47
MKVVICFPETAEGKLALEEKVAEAHAEAILRCIELRAKNEDEKSAMLEYLMSRIKT